ncbi:hypothetical protein AURDEDRAFT_185040 [Auricularia subglabra TFB-10046 SS5]|nr:hypothetical protein AURDEDRAFT_185040 [Auricularia subglabra TFB-10046 SS5]
MSHSDRHHPRTADQPKATTTSSTAAQKPTPVRKPFIIRPFDPLCLRTVKICCQVLHHVAANAPKTTVYPDEEPFIRQLYADLRILDKWAYKALDSMPWRGGAPEDASPLSAQPPAPAPPAPATLTPAPAAPQPAATPTTTLPPKPAAPSEPVTVAPDPVPQLPRPQGRSPLNVTLPTPRTTPQPDPSPSSRLIIRYRDTPCPQRHLHPRTIVQSINSCFKSPVLSAVSYSRDGALMLHTLPPFTARRLLDHSDTLRDKLGTLLFPDVTKKPTPAFDPGEPWSKVVLHGVPLPIWDDKTTVECQLRALASDLCSPNKVSPASIQLLRPLCPRATQAKLFQSSTETSPHLMSVLLCISDGDEASRLLRDGAVVQSNPDLPGNTPCGVAPNWVYYNVLKYNTTQVFGFNFARGGATIDKSIIPPPLPEILDISEQIDEFEVGYTGSAPRNTISWTGETSLFSTWVGINDISGSYLRGDSPQINDMLTDSYINEMRRLFQLGGRNFMFLNVPPMDRSPVVLSQPEDGQIMYKAALSDFNSKLAAHVAAFQATTPGVSTWFVDTYAAVTKLLDDPTKFGFQDGTSFGDGDDFIWCNAIHISPHTHNFIAKAVTDALSGTGLL